MDCLDFARLFTRKLWIGAGFLFLLFIGLEGYSLFQSWSYRAPVRPGEAEMHLNGLTFEVLAFLQDQNPRHFQRVEEHGKALNAFIKNYAAQKDAGTGTLASSYQILRETTLQLLQASQAQTAQRVSIAGDLAQNAERFTRSAKTLQQAARGRRNTDALQDAQKLFDANAADVRQMTEAAQLKGESLDHFIQAQKALDQMLRAAGAPTKASRVPYGLAISNVAAYAWPIHAALSTLMILVFFGVFLSLQRVGERLLHPLKEFMRVAQAAAAGDVTQSVALESSEGLGSVAEALNRLIGVLARSQNLVYHLAALVESSGDAIISQNLDGTILSWNKGAQKIYGYAAEEVQGNSISMLTPLGQTDEFPSLLERVKQGERIPPFETAHVARNGRVVPVFVRLAPIHDSTKTIIGVSLCAHDMTDWDSSLRRPLSSQKNPVPAIFDGESPRKTFSSTENKC